MTQGQLLHNDDNGVTWTKYALNLPTDLDLDSVSFVDADHGWMIDAASRLYVTSDGGATWGELN